MGFREASKFTRIAFGLAVGGFLTDIIGFPSPYWVVGPLSSQGLFQGCALGECVSLPMDLMLGWEKAVMAMEVLGFLACLGCFVLMVLYAHVKNDQTILQTMAIGLAFAAAGLILLGVIIYGAKLSGVTFGWSFGMTIVSGLFLIGVGALNIVDKFSSR
ncbi:uncharacterized protein LOC124123853 isoform X4 [Haliotis rufescens]|uniref:uncharacterized protein LOC124123853 isoform X4 n=1 Tax=Haliotis rufescens TaxID=6454 RepID=UPI00201F62C9|nr:uncharacterized protein LOC124123853 isoform X4 [Haliotis rufescens]